MPFSVAKFFQEYFLFHKNSTKLPKTVRTTARTIVRSMKFTIRLISPYRQGEVMKLWCTQIQGHSWSFLDCQGSINSLSGIIKFLTALIWSYRSSVHQRSPVVRNPGSRKEHFLSRFFCYWVNLYFI